MPETSIFFSPVPNQILFDFLDTICVKMQTHYIFDWSTFRKVKFYKPLYDDFILAIKSHYRENKRFYVTRELTYNNITTILRQICKHNSIPVKQKINYNGSSYNVDYCIFFVV